MSIWSGLFADVARDARFAVRRMHRRPALAVAICLTIALGLGASAAILTTSDAALIEPLPYAQPGRLVHLWEVRAGTDERSPTSYPTLLDWRARVTSFTGLEGYDAANLTVGVSDEARMLRGAQVTTGFFRLLGVPVARGRDLSREDAAIGGPSIALVSDRFAATFPDGAVLGKTIAVNGTPHTIVGVLPGSFHFALLQDADIFLPLRADAARRADRLNRSIRVIGRLRPGVSLTRARAELSTVMAELATEDPDALAGRGVAAVPLRDALLGTMRPIFESLLGAVLLLLAIMGANLALLTFARHMERTPELAMRSALGAGRGRILRQLLVESLLPALIGAALGAVVGQMATRALLAAIPDTVRISMPYLAGVRVDARAVATLTVLAIVLAIGFGVGPALLVTSPSRGMGGSRNTMGRGDRRVRRGLVLAQVALTVVLLVGAGLFVASFSMLVRRDTGLTDPEGLVTARARLEGSRYATDLAQRQFYEALLARAAALPGVRTAALVDEVPGGGGGMTTFDTPDRPQPPSRRPRAMLRIVGGAYFSTMGIPVIAGRSFANTDGSDAPPVALVSASLAKLLGGEGRTLGRRLQLTATGRTEWEVVGIAGDVQVTELDAESPPVVYLSHLQRAENSMTLVLRTEVGDATVSRELRRLVKRMDPEVPVYGVARLDRQLESSKAVFSRRLPMILCGAFALAALVLSLMALYAICAHELATRRREFGIRIALGSGAGAVRRLVLDEAMIVSAAGVGIGLVVAALASRAIQSLLFGIAAGDWRVYAIAALGVLGSSVAATLAPALRAGAVDPANVLREQ